MAKRKNIERKTQKSEPKFAHLIPDDCDIEATIDWKIYFDREHKKPCGQGNFVAVAGLDEKLPMLNSKPVSVQERFAVMIILKKNKKLKGRPRPKR